MVGETVTSQFAYGIGSSIASLFKSEKILVGRDGRTSSQMLAEAAVAGILAEGSNVEDCGVITTPGLQFLAKIGTVPGLVITASHNPPEYNGFKVVDSDGIEIPREKEERIENLVTKDPWNVSRIAGQREQRVLPLEPYLSSIKNYVRKEKLTNRLKVAVDTGNGVSSLTTPVLLRRIGCQVVTINDNIDGRFPGRTSEPRPENLGPLSTLVRQEKAALGVAHDGDGDRAVFVDETGVVHSGDKSLTLIEDEILRENPRAKVVTPVNSSMSVTEVARKRKGRVILTKVGSIHVARTMIRENAILGGEENGGIFYAPHQPVRDGTMATVLILNSILDNRMPLSKLMARLPNFFMAKEKRKCPDEKKKDVMKRIRQSLGYRVTSTIDGVRVDIKDRGWFLVRPSGTEPLIRIYMEGRTENDLKRLLDEFKPLFDETIGN
ncbi:MAG: phosphoglucosamine mutase [Thaumarchaeota archaeon 13_1_40CM_3_50_5]|nr:MAG: phosphoglucosamine mutase [Thaumarchaeota archaeon 13_1_40CM_3_50_5]